MLVPAIAAALVPALSGCSGAIEKRVRSSMDEIWVQGNLSLIDQKYEPELAYEVKAFVRENRTLYPDLELHIEDLVVKSGDIVTTWRVEGTHKDLGERVVLRGVSLRKIDKGKIVAEEMFFDRKAVYDQLGFTVTPPDALSPFEPMVERAVAPSEEVEPPAVEDGAEE
jgi:hypothetical protein